ncbi:MAG: sulfite exporter TauE/SafE family protein [Thermodesulfobacteriota bacterium]
MVAEWTAFPAGFVIATAATLTGFGGGILWMPYLVYLAKLEPAQAVVTSLIIQVGGMASGSIAVIRTRKIDFRLSLYLAAGSFVGVPVGVWLSRFIPPESLVFILGVGCLAIALVFVYLQESFGNAYVKRVSLRLAAPYLWLATLFSVFTGILSMGIGDFLVPILRNRLRLTMEAAMGTCLVVMAMNAALAATLHVMIGDTYALNTILWAIPGVLIGGQVGPRLAGRIEDQTLKEIFIYGLSLAGIHFMFNNL